MPCMVPPQFYFFKKSFQILKMPCMVSSNSAGNVYPKNTSESSAFFVAKAIIYFCQLLTDSINTLN